MIFLFICWCDDTHQLICYVLGLKSCWKVLCHMLVFVSCNSVLFVYKVRFKRGWLTSKIKFHLLKGNSKNFRKFINEMSRFLLNYIMQCILFSEIRWTWRTLGANHSKQITFFVIFFLPKYLKKISDPLPKESWEADT